MERPAQQHLTLDELDLVLEGSYPEAVRAHVNTCPDCASLLKSERMLVRWLGALPLHVPAAGFEDRVMARVQIATPQSALATLRRRVLASRRSMAIAASVAVTLVGSLVASVTWSFGHQDVLAALGNAAVRNVADFSWLAARGLATGIIAQPWYGAARDLVDSPARLATAAGGLTIAWAAGMLLMRRLIAIPAGSVAHDHA